MESELIQRADGIISAAEMIPSILIWWCRRGYRYTGTNCKGILSAHKSKDGYNHIMGILPARTPTKSVLFTRLRGTPIQLR